MKQPLKERFQQLAGIKPLYGEQIEKWGRWNLDTSTQAGKDIKKQSDSIPTVSSSDPGRVTKDKEGTQTRLDYLEKQIKDITDEYGSVF